MKAQAGYDRVERSGIMAGMRGQFPPDVAVEIVRTLIESAQIDVFEFTLNSDRAIEAMQAAKREFGDEAMVGMGTVLDADAARRVLDAGADFIVSPAFNRDVIALAQDADVLIAPGVITPTEAVDAWATGVKLLKIFPIGVLGVDYLKAVRGPLDHMKFLCNGAISDQNVGDFMKAGAVACGTSGWLTGDGTMALDTIARRARILREIITRVRSDNPQAVTV